jgi:hypothetical protein
MQDQQKILSFHDKFVLVGVFCRKKVSGLHTQVR